MADLMPENEVEEHRMPLLEHLRELRRRIMIAGAATFVCAVICLMYSNQLIDFLAAPIRQVMDTGMPPTQMDLVYDQLTAPLHYLPGWDWINEGKSAGKLTIQASFEGINAYLQVALVGGLIAASPLILFQVWGFVAPGLYKTERRVVIPLTAASTLLFAIGASFAYIVVLPLAFRFFINVVNAEPYISIHDAILTVVKITGAFGLCFQLPVFAWFLARMGLIDARDMIFGFRYAIVVIFIVAALITPPEVMTQIMLAVPLLGLYGLAILVVRFASTKTREFQS